MLPFKRILFPVDYSERCGAIVPYVQDMTRHFSAELTVLHAYGIGVLPYTEFAVADPAWIKELRELEEKRIRKFAADAFPTLHVDVILEEGEAGRVIDKVVQHHGTDLVMMPTHGHGPVRRFLLGSVTTKVLHDVSAAVWTGAGAALDGHPAGGPYKSMVCALDDTEEAEAVLKTAAFLAGSYHARLYILHAVAVPPMAVDTDFAGYRKEIMDASDLRLRELKGKLGIDAPHSVVDTMFFEGIRDAVAQRKADLLITGRGSAQASFNRLWSRLYPLIREAPCPVLSV